MKRLVCILIFLISLKAQASGFKTTCPLSEEKKLRLIEESPYIVNDIKCVKNKYYRWYISNKKFVIPFKNENQSRLAKKSKKVDRKLASDFSNEKEGPKNVQEDLLDQSDTGIFDFGLGAGARYYSHTQSGALGSANIGTLFLNNLSLFTSYTRREFGVKMNIDSYKYKYSANSSESEKQLYSYSLQVSYNRFLLGLGVEQQPLFKNSNGTIEMVAESAVLPFLGYKWHIGLSEKIKTYLDIQASASYLVDSSASDSSVKLSSHSGYGADVKTKLVRKLGSSKRYPLYYFWSNDISYRNYERNVEWSTSSGKANTEQINLNSTIGLKIEF